MENNNLKVFIIGGGAAGLTAAIFAARGGAEVHVLEAGSKPAAKILVTGGGRCNFTNLNLSAEKYNTSGSDFVSKVLDAFGAYDALDYFRSLGIFPVIYDGYAYPKNEEAKTVADALIRTCEGLGVKIHNNTKVYAIGRTDKGFNIRCESYNYEADKVIIACGGKSYPHTGSDGSGYAIATGLGHDVTPLYPALGGLITDSPVTKAAGTRVRAKITLLEDDNPICSQIGEIQINNYGLSGIPVMNLSGRAAKPLKMNKRVSLKMDFAPEYESFDIINGYNEKGIGYRGFVPESLSKVLADIGKGKDSFVINLKAFYVNINGVCSFNQAHVTAGGINTNEINPLSMQSKKVPGLFFSGEIIDVDGLCGGYNLHFAWASGAIAGTYAATAESYIGNPIDDEIIKLYKASEISGRRS